MWVPVSHSERPLHVDELCYALGVEEGSTNLDIRNNPNPPPKPHPATAEACLTYLNFR